MDIFMMLGLCCIAFSFCWTCAWLEVFSPDKDMEKFYKKSPQSKIWVSRLNKASIVSSVLGVVFLFCSLFNVGGLK